MSNEKLTLTRLELKTIIEDAFIDGWNTQDNDWSGPGAYLELHEEFGDSCETTDLLKDLQEEIDNESSQDNVIRTE